MLEFARQGASDAKDSIPNYIIYEGQSMVRGNIQNPLHLGMMWENCALVRCGVAPNELAGAEVLGKPLVRLSYTWDCAHVLGFLVVNTPFKK